MRFRLLLHSGDATYDAVTKTYTFELDKRIDRPVSLKIQKAHYSNAAGSVHPLVVYLRSNSLSELIKSKHTLRIKNTNHEQRENILCTLSETHAVGRYDLQNDGRVFPTDPDRVLRTIDLQFSDNGELLGQSAASGTNSTGTDAEIDAINTAGKLLAWTDFADSRMFDLNMVASTGPGSNVNYIYDRINSTLIWSLAYGNNLKVVAVGPNGAQGVYKDGSWQSVVDSSPLGSIGLENEFCVHFIFQQNQINDYSVLLYFTDIKIAMYQGALNYWKNSTNQISHPISGITIIPLQQYLISIHRRAVVNGYEFYYRVEKLSDNTVQEATSEPTSTGSVGANQVWRVGLAATSFNQYWGPTIVHNNLNAAHIASSRTWLRNTFDGTTTSSSQETTTAESEWFVELDIETKN